MHVKARQWLNAFRKALSEGLSHEAASSAADKASGIYNRVWFVLGEHPECRCGATATAYFAGAGTDLRPSKFTLACPACGLKMEQREPPLVRA